MSQHKRNASHDESARQPKRSAAVAGLLAAILPGAGHYYAGQRVRGVSYFALACVVAALLYWANTTSDLALAPFIQIALFLLAAVAWLWQILSAIAATAKRTFAPTAGLVLALLFFYVMGWQASDINLLKLFAPTPDTLKIFTEVIWPWDAAIQREQLVASANTPFASPCPENMADAPQQIRGDGSKPWVTVDPACGVFSTYDVQSQALVPGTTLTFSGGGFQPDKDIEIWWISSIGNAFPPYYHGEALKTKADQDGNFSITFPAPQASNESGVGVLIHKVEARQLVSQGALQLTGNFKLAISRMLVTIFQALMATSLGVILAIPAGFLAARNLMYRNPATRTIYFAVRFFMNVTRSIEPLVWAIIATVWVGLGPFAGVLALMVHTVASNGKLYSEAIEDIDPGPIEAVTATGANRIQTIVYGIVPQVVPPFLSFTIFRWDINVRMATIVGLVGAGGIGQILFQWMNQFLWREVGMAAWLITITVTAMDYFSTELRKRFA